MGQGMTFVQAFYSFSVEMTNVDSGLSGKLRVKTARHPEEPIEHLYARVLAYVHSWERGLEFSRGLFDPDEPTIWKKNVLGQTTSWINVGCPARKKLERALRAGLPAPDLTKYHIYFYSDQQVQSFCGELRGSKTNWISQIRFFKIPSQILEELLPLERSSATWFVTIVDDTLYLNCDGRELETVLTSLDMWKEFQETIAV